MDQFWLYVIIGIIYAISRVLKKPENQSKDFPEDIKPDRNAPRPAGDRPKALTFEDLLKEISEAKQPQQQASYPVKRFESQPVDYDDELEDEEKRDLEEVSYQKRKEESERVTKVYEEAKRMAFQRPSLEETLNVRDTNVQFGKFKVFEAEKQRNLLEDYTKDFQDPDGFKRALVMSEILKRKF